MVQTQRRKISRRGFLKAVAAASAAPYVIMSSALVAAASLRPASG